MTEEEDAEDLSAGESEQLGGCGGGRHGRFAGATGSVGGSQRVGWREPREALQGKMISNCLMSSEPGMPG